MAGFWESKCYDSHAASQLSSAHRGSRAGGSLAAEVCTTSSFSKVNRGRGHTMRSRFQLPAMT